MTLRRLLLAPLFALSLLPAFAATVFADEPLEVEIVHVDGERGITTVFLSVFGEDGRSIDDLEPTDFSVNVSGREVPRIELTNNVDETLGVAVVMALDVSGSMAPHLGQAQEGASALLSLLEEADEAALISFADAVSVEQEITSSRLDLETAIAGLTAEGATALYDVVVASLEIAAEAELPRQAIVLLSDGQDSQASTTTREEAIGRARTAGVPIYAIGYGPEPDREFLADLARASGGRELFAPGRADLRAAFEELGELLRRQYVMQFAPGVAPITRTLEMTVEVTTSTGSGFAIAEFENPIPARPVITTETPVAATAAAPAPAPVAEAPVEEPASSSSFGTYFLIALLVIALGVGVYLAVRRWRQRPDALDRYALREFAGREAAPIELASRESSAAVLAVVEGPRAGARLDIDGDVISIGRAPTCTLVLPGEYGEVASEQVRVWWREGKLMLHSLDPAWQTRVEGAPVEWATLNPGDRFQVGPHTIELQRAEERAPAATAPLVEQPATGGD